MGEQVHVVRMSSELSRRLQAFLDGGSAAYSSLSEFVSVAVANQLTLEAEGRDASSAASARTPGLLQPPPTAPADLLEVVDPVHRPLFVLTNRLVPLKIAVRVLANAGAGGDWPVVEDFQNRAAGAARELGLRLRAADARDGRYGSSRRWVALPVGADEKAASSRFAASFTLWSEDEHSAGPLALLGLAGTRDRRAILTQRGWDVASQASPLLGECAGHTLSEREAQLFRQALASSHDELNEIRLFMSAVESTGGGQADVDSALVESHRDWTDRRAAAQRSAMIGRLGDAGVVAVSGRGPKATVSLTLAAQELR